MELFICMGEKFFWFVILLTLKTNPYEFTKLFFIKPIACSIFYEESFYLYQLNLFVTDSSVFSNAYLEIMRKLITLASNTLSTMIAYTQKHLSRRHYDGLPLFQLDVIQNDFADIVLQKEFLSVISLGTHSSILLALDTILKILNQLAKLSGARAVLKNNVLNLMFHLFFLKKFI